MNIAETSPFAVGSDGELSALYEGLEAAELQPLWTIAEELLTPIPRPAK